MCAFFFHYSKNARRQTNTLTVHTYICTHIHVQNSDAWPAVFPSTPIPVPMVEVVAAPDKAMDTTVWLDELDVNGTRGRGGGEAGL